MAFELRLGNIRGRFPQDLIRSLELPILALELFEAPSLIRAQARAAARVSLRLAHPSARHFGRAVNTVCCPRGSILSMNGHSGKPGTVQQAWRRFHQATSGTFRPRASPWFGRTHKDLGEIDAHVLADTGVDDLEQGTVAAPEVCDGRLAGQLDERPHAPDPRYGVWIVLRRAAIVLNNFQIIVRSPTIRLP